MLAVSQLANASPALEITMSANPYETFEMHYTSGDALAAMEATPHDVVVLQELTDQILYNMPSFLEYGAKLDALVKAHGATTLLFLTWGSDKAPVEEQTRLTNAYLQLAQQIHARVAPVGPAWRNTIAASPGINLYDADRFHQNEKGSYLAACVFFAALYGQSAVGQASPNAAVGADAALLQTQAWITWTSQGWTY